MLTSLLQCYVASRIHCVWLLNGELQGLFECVHDGSINLEAAPVHLVINKELLQEYYLDQKKHIPHIQKMITMQSMGGLQVTQQ